MSPILIRAWLSTRHQVSNITAGDQLSHI